MRRVREHERESERGEFRKLLRELVISRSAPTVALTFSSYILSTLSFPKIFLNINLLIFCIFLLLSLPKYLYLSTHTVVTITSLLFPPSHLFPFLTALPSLVSSPYFLLSISPIFTRAFSVVHHVCLLPTHPFYISVTPNVCPPFPFSATVLSFIAYLQI